MTVFGLISQLAWGPGINGAASVSGRGAGKGKDLNDLLGRERRRRAGTRCISEGLGNQLAQHTVVSFGRSKLGLGTCPASTPAADGFG